MKAIIEQLRTLNEIDVRIGIVNKDLDRLPKELAEKQAPIRAIKGTIERANAEIIKLKIAADGADLEFKSGEEGLKRLGNQIGILKTTKEFESIRRQMDAQRVWNKEYEDKTLALFDQVETKKAEITKNESTLAELEKNSASETERIEKELVELRARLEELKASRAKLEPEIPEKEMTVYTRIANRGMVALSFVKGGNCSVCYMKLPLQIQNLALLGREMICCPSCGRILTPEPKS